MTHVAVTGGAGGIGRSIAEHFLRTGAQVTIGDVDVQAVQRTAIELGAHAVGVDVGDETSFSSFLDAAETTHGPLDVLVNNAGVDWVGAFDEEPSHVSRRQIEVNLLGTIVGSRLALQRMLPRRAGHVVNVASAVGRVPQPGSAVYSATKWGIVGLTESLRLEYRDSGVGFTLVHPGQVRTAMLDGTKRGSRLLPVVTADAAGRTIVDAVRRGRFEVWVPSSQWVGVKLGNFIPRAGRERVLLAMGVDRIAQNADMAARRGYHDRAFGEAR